MGGHYLLSLHKRIGLVYLLLKEGMKESLEHLSLVIRKFIQFLLRVIMAATKRDSVSLPSVRILPKQV